MAFEISGYVLEPIRVGQANSPFTQTPDNYIENQTTFDAAYPSDESEPRTDYLVMVTDEGTPDAGLLVNAEFGWTKNEIVQRFDYAAAAGRFRPLPGSSPIEVGFLASDSNTNRLMVRAPVQAAPIADAPYRIAVGATGSGTTWTVAIVANDSGFGSPAAGTVELSLDTGNLNWNATDLTTFSGQVVRFQRQQFFDFSDSTGLVGLPGEVLVLNPLPGPGQFPLLRFGYGLYLQTVEVANEGAFGSPVAGTVEWAQDTGRLNFNAGDVVTYAGTPVYYDGVLFAQGVMLPRQSIGTVDSPTSITGLPPSGADLIFALTAASEYYQFPQFSYVTTFTSGKIGVVEINSGTGAVQFSASDQATYAGEAVTVVFGDLPIERGVSVRLLRTPVNLDGIQGIKDVTSIYEVTNAVWSDPIVGAPQVFLPSLPIDDSSYPLVVKVTQGQGTFTSNNFPRLDVTSPPAGLGFYIDFDEGVLIFAQRKEQVLVPILTPSPSVMLPDPLLLESNALLELETAPGSGTYNTLTLGQDAILDATSGQVSLTSSQGLVVANGTSGITSSSTLTDTNADFLTSGVAPGDILEVLSPSSVEGIYTVSVVNSAISLDVVETFPASETGVSYNIRSDREILADRFFEEVSLIDPSTSVERIRSLGTATNSPRLSVPVAYVGSSGVRLGSTSFATVTLVANDGAFTSPAAGTVEISQDTGNLNFSVSDLGTEAFWARTLVLGVDYDISAELGLIQFTDRMLALEEVRVTYTTAPPNTDPATDPDPPVTEYGRFLIRKELTQDHPTTTSTLEFNVDGLAVASTPPPAVFRGGRPQVLGVQCTVDTVNSTITFLADSQITDALPHGSTVGPDERVYIDYYVTQAVGGENTITVLSPPMLTAEVNISEVDDNGDPNNQFTIIGDHTVSFPVGHLLKIEDEQIYLIGSSSYDIGADLTTVTLYGNQVFRDTFIAPTVYVSSGPTPITSAPLVPTYFASELQTYEAVARGSNTFKIPGNRTVSYRTGTVVLFTNGTQDFTDFAQVAGASYDSDTGLTTVMLNSGVARQYVSGSELLLYSVRPLFDPPTTEVTTSQIPVLTEPFVVYRKIDGEPGVILSSPQDYAIDESGRVVFTSPLLPNEEFGIFYVGLQSTVQLGTNLRATYTCQIAPNDSNGLAGQILLADYFILSPDSFYYRVETLTNFRGEYAQEIAAEASSGSSGPQTENASQPQLFEQGRTSLYFDEKHLANQDLIARSSLLFYNNSVNLLEAYLRTLDGRVVGNNDGLLLFDGTTGEVHPPGAVTNQIDDTIQVSPAPYTITYPPFAVTSIGTFKKYYLPGPDSRFFPTKKNFFAVSAVVAGTTQAGDEVVDTGSTNITAVSQLYTRLAWAVVTESTDITGTSTLSVDFADGSEPGFSDQAQTYARPPFLTNMECVVQRRDGSFINDSSSPVTVTAVAPNQLTISGLAGTADIGTTIYRSPIDGSTQSGADELVYYQYGRDFFFNGDNGQIVYVPEFAPAMNVAIKEEQALSGTINLVNTLTEPSRIPALFGGTEDDDGDLSFPIQTPDPDNEQVGYVSTEEAIIHSGTGFIRTATTAPFVGTGDLDATRTIITLTAGTFPSPTPQVHDLVRILTGLNGPSSFVRVVSSTANSVTVDTAFALVDSGFTFEVAVSASTVTGTSDLTSTVTQLDDATATFLSSAQVGQTVVFTSGVNNGERRQIESILSNTSLVMTPALPSVPGTATYRIDDSLATYGGTSTDYLTQLEATLVGQAGLYPNQQTYLLDFLDQVFTDISTGSNGQVSAGLMLLDDAGATFLTDGVLQAHYLYIETGPNAGFYAISSVNSETQLQVDVNFSTTESSISYRVVRLFGVSRETVDSLFVLYQESVSLETSAASFETLITTPVAVVRLGSSDNDSFARGTLSSDLDARDAIIDARLTSLTTAIETVENVLTSTDTLYDTRFVWIDARINLENGLVVQQTTAEENRVKAQADFLKQLTKLLAVES